MAFRFEPLGREHDRTGFRCGLEPLDLSLQQRARNDLERRVAAAFAMNATESPKAIAGYYTLSSFSVEVGELPESLHRTLPRYPRLPATLLGRLGRDARFPGTGYLLLMDALPGPTGSPRRLRRERSSPTRKTNARGNSTARSDSNLLVIPRTGFSDQGRPLIRYRQGKLGHVLRLLPR